MTRVTIDMGKGRIYVTKHGERRWVKIGDVKGLARLLRRGPPKPNIFKDESPPYHVR